MCFLLGAMLFTASTAFAGDAGTVKDPLITWSYMQNTVLPKLKTRIASAVPGAFAKLNRTSKLTSVGKTDVDALQQAKIAERVAGVLTAELPTLYVPSVTGQREVLLNKEWGIQAPAGTTVLVLSGSVRLSVAEGGVCIDIKNCKEIATDAELSAGSYVCVAEESAASFISAEGAVVYVTGPADYLPPLSGEVKCVGAVEYLSKLTVDTASLKNAVGLSYGWYIDGQKVSSEAAYTPKEADIGKTLALKVSASQKACGSLLLSLGTVEKATVNSPVDAPKVKSALWNTVTLEPEAGMEYRLGNGAWQKSNVFENLQPTTSYVFYKRSAETATTAASEVSKALSYKTPPKAALTSSVYAISTQNNRLTGIGAGVTVEALKKNMDYPAYIVVYNTAGQKAKDTDLVGTGWKISCEADGTVIGSVLAVVTGDANGDGKISLTDYAKVKSHLLGTALTGNSFIAADVNGDGKITLTDYAKIKSALLSGKPLPGLKN